MALEELDFDPFAGAQSSQPEPIGALKAIAGRLAGPLYNNMIKTKGARALVRAVEPCPA